MSLYLVTINDPNATKYEIQNEKYVLTSSEGTVGFKEYCVTAFDNTPKEDGSYDESLLPDVGPLSYEEVHFSDQNLESIIRKTIEKPDGPIRKTDLMELTKLDAENQNITDLRGIEYCTNLYWLNLDGNQIEDINPLANLTELRVLNLSNNQITDISPIANLTKIGEWEGWVPRYNGVKVHLDLSGNKINDISPLVENQGLGKNDGIDLRGNPLNNEAYSTYIPALLSKDVNLLYSPKPSGEIVKFADPNLEAVIRDRNYAAFEKA